MLTPEEAELQLALARQRVADAIRDVLTETIYSGSRDGVALAVRDLALATTTGDLTMARAAAFDLSVASAAYAASLDTELPPELRQRRSRRSQATGRN